jgi:hypothetical protein
MKINLWIYDQSEIKIEKKQVKEERIKEERTVMARETQLRRSWHFDGDAMILIELKGSDKAEFSLDSRQ